LSAFLSGYLNRRTDAYGGSVENRARLTCQVVQAVKRRAGEDFPVICRIHGREALPGGIDEAEAQEISRLLEDAGADALHISAAIFPVNPKLAASFAIQVGGPPSREVPSGCYSPYASAVKKAVEVPVIAVGKLNEPRVAEGVVRDGIADAVAVGRGLIADPYLPEKILAGRWDAIVRCEDCLLCHTTLQTQRDVNCSVNPRPWEPRGGAR
jgi:2,4-dienoyl-CoA reductase-like NADH-dependent reductase (Old Yellow Enzyme family)